MAQTNTISSASVIFDWGISLYDLSYLILKHNLVVINPSDIPPTESIIDPSKHRLNTEKLIDAVLRHPFGLIDKLLWLPEVKPLLEKLYKQNRIKKWEHLLNLEQYACVHSSADLKSLRESHEEEIKSIIEEHESIIKKSPNVFSMLGKVWFVKFKKNEWGLYADHEKYKYIAHLLDLSSQSTSQKISDFSISNIVLVDKVRGKKSKTEFLNYVEHGENLSDDSGLSEILSPEEIDRFKQIGINLLIKLKKARQQDKQKDVNEMINQFESYMEYLIRQFGIFPIVTRGLIYLKIYKRPSKELEKLRQLIKNQLTNAIKDFKDRMPSLFRHLKKGLQAKSFRTHYYPESPIVWHISI